MSNMSYCRYHNTLIDLRDCYYALQEEAEEAEEGNVADISNEEAVARKNLIELCIVIGEEFSRHDQIFGKTGRA